MLWYVYLADFGRLKNPMFLGHLAHGPSRDKLTEDSVCVLDANLLGKGTLVWFPARRVFVASEIVRNAF